MQEQIHAIIFLSQGKQDNALSWRSATGLTNLGVHCTQQCRRASRVNGISPEVTNTK